MEQYISILKNDFVAFRKATENNNFVDANMFSNRLIADACFINHKEFAILGAILKEVVQHVGKGGKELKDHKRILFSEFEKEIENPEMDLKQIWETYFKFYNTSLPHLIIESERTTYKPNVEFSKAITTWGKSFLIENRDVLTGERNLVLAGIESELRRVYKVSGLNSKQLILITIITFLDRYYRYVLFSSVDSEDLFDPDKLKDKMSPFIDKLIEVFESIEEKEIGDVVDQGSSFLFDICLAWREMFVRYMEIQPLISQDKRKRIELPDEAKLKIKEIMSQALQKQVEE
jgi:hypothetical protein